MEPKLLAVFSSGVPMKVTALCRELGISRQTLYEYRRRFEAEGPTGLVERSRRPHSSPQRIPAETEDAIIRLRKELRVDCGAQAIAYHLARRGEIVPSVATIHRVLVRRGMVTPQPRKRPHAAWRRFEWPRPNDASQIDATTWALADGQTVWIMDILDDHSRALVAARVDTGPTAKVTWEAFTSAVQEWGLPAHVMNDNGSCFTGRLARNGAADFERMLRSAGIKQICSRPSHPQTCGKLERSHQTTKTWLRLQPPARSLEELQHQLDRWRAHYNHARPQSPPRSNSRRTLAIKPTGHSWSSHRRTSTCQRAPRPQSRPHRLERLRRRHR
ncbi:IS481 family transposase [Mycobacterium decipiens]|nr:IS481 family transposase [Mycobacterium decipiens]